MTTNTHVDYRPDRLGTATLLRSREMAALVTEAAEEAKRHAEQIAPRDTGHYAASFRVETTHRGGPHHDRAEARLINDAGYAWAVEFVNGDRVLGRAAEFIEHATP
jgi:hypothetical protein